MKIILLLIGASITMAALFLIGFIWAYKSGQFKDDYTPSIRILLDDTKKKIEK